MRRPSPTRLLLAAAALLAAATSAMAADPVNADAAGHGHEKAGVLPTIEQGIVPMIVTLVTFGMVLALLGVFVWPKIMGGLKDRENKIREEIESAEMARQQAKEALEQYQKSLADARAEAQKMLETTRAQQTSLAAELRAKADVELTDLRDRAMRDIEAAKRAAVSEMYAQSTNLAAMIAGKILRRQISTNDNQQLVEESLRQMETLRT